jgi:hypothetical protein
MRVFSKPLGITVTKLEPFISSKIFPGSNVCERIHGVDKDIWMAADLPAYSAEHDLIVE